MRHALYKLILSTIAVMRLHYLAGPSSRGRGAILMLNHVRPYEPKPFEPNRSREITPEFLDRVLSLVKARGYDIIPLSDVEDRLRADEPGRPFVAITVDGGYRDLVEFALPAFRRHKAPFTVFVTTGFAQGVSPLWWIDLERSIEKLSAIAIETEDFRFEAHCSSPEDKLRVFDKLIRILRKGTEARLQRIVAEIAVQAGVNSMEIVQEECLTFDELRTLALEPLASFGAQTMSHPILSKHDYNFARREISKSRAIIEETLHRPVRHFSYPFGDRASAGMREFYLAASAGFDTAVTKRPGLLFLEHAEYLFALPRLQLNGDFQQESYVDVLLSGLPFLLYNRGQTLRVS